MKTITSTFLRSNLKYFLDLVSESYQTLLIPRNNEDDAVVMMPLSEYNSLIETNYLTSTKANREKLEQALNDVKEGNVIEVKI